MSTSLSPETVQSLVDRLAQGDHEAGRQMLEAYSRRLLHLACQKLSPIGFRRAVAAEDVVASVCKTFIRRIKTGKKVLYFEDDDRLFAWLATVTVRKCYKTIRHYRRVDGNWVFMDDEDGSVVEAISGRYESIEDYVIQDVIDELLKGLTPEERAIAERLLLDESVNQVALDLGHTSYSVKMVLKQLRERLEVMLRKEDRID